MRSPRSARISRIVERAAGRGRRTPPFRRPTRSGGNRPSSAVAVSDLPEPLSPTMRERLARRDVERHRRDRLDAPVRRLDRDAEVAHRKAGRALVGGRDEAGQEPRAELSVQARSRSPRADRRASRSASHEQVDRQDRRRQQQARPEQQQRRLVHGGARAADHQAPGRRRRHDAEPEERQPAFDHDRGRERERELHQQRSGDVRQDRARQDARRRGAERADRLDIVHAARRQDLAIGDAGEARRVEDRQHQDQRADARVPARSRPAGRAGSAGSTARRRRRAR